MPVPSFTVDRRRTARALAVGRRRRTFGEADILAAVRAWHDRFGECPRTIDWDPSRARREDQAWRAERFAAGDWPTTRMVARQFGTFNAAISAAGLTPRVAPSRQRPNLSGPDAVVRAFIEWTRRYGDVPTMADWDTARARRLGQDWRIARYHAGDWPSARTVALHFGSFSAAALAAGLTPRARGVHHNARAQQRHENGRAVAGATAPPRSARLGDIADRVRAVARARRDDDPVAVRAALLDLAGSALALADAAGTE